MIKLNEIAIDTTYSFTKSIIMDVINIDVKRSKNGNREKLFKFCNSKVGPVLKKNK